MSTKGKIQCLFQRLWDFVSLLVLDAAVPVASSQQPAQALGMYRKENIKE